MGGSKLQTIEARCSDGRPILQTGAFERYQKAVPEQSVVEMLQQQSAFSREGPLSAWIVIWLMIFQRLHPKGTLSVAVRELLRGAVQPFVQLRDGQALSANTSAYSQARSKLPLEVAERVSDLMFVALQGQAQTLPGVGRAVFLLDGSTLLLPHTKELAKTYPPARNQNGASHWPVIRVLVAHDVVSGLAVRPCWGALDGVAAVSEQGLAKEILGRLPEAAIALGDRNFGIFSVAYHAQLHNHPGVFRLTAPRARKLRGGALPNAQTDRNIVWTPTREDLRNNPEIPATALVEGRLLAFKVRDATGKWQKLYFFTTLKLPADQILEIYGYRWNIETDLRSLKREVRLYMLEAKSPAMVAKELVLGVAAYNLTRGAIHAAATALGLDPRQFSFSQAQDTINAYLPAFANARNDQERQGLMQEMLRVFAQSKLPKRARKRRFPRQIWPRPCSFPKRKVAANRKVARRKKGVA